MAFAEDPTEIRARFTGIIAGQSSSGNASQTEVHAATLRQGVPANERLLTSPSMFPAHPFTDSPGRLGLHPLVAAGDRGEASYLEAAALAPVQSVGPSFMRVQGKLGKHRIDLWAMFPSVCSLFMLLVFATPIGLSLHVGQDRHTRRWIGRYIHMVALIPGLVGATHWLHVVRRRPSKSAILFSLLLPSILILFLGDAVLLTALDFSNKFAALDCDSFVNKRLMDREFQDARSFYEECLSKLVAGERAQHGNLTFASAATLTRIQDCPGYEAAALRHPESWQYLQHTETELQCGGWCDQSPPLWSFATVRDSCSSSVSELMASKTSRCMYQVIVYTLVVLAVSSIALISGGPWIRSHGLAW